MHKNNALDKAANFIRSVYVKLIKIDDTPHNIAVGFSLGVFAGIMPFAGPLAAIFLAMLFKANKVSAFLGGLLTNAWITVPAFLFSIKVGAFIFRIDANIIRAQWAAFLKDFHLSSLVKLSVIEIALPVITGYIVIALFLACTAYLASFMIMKLTRR
jgi:hypothetical protein